MKAYIYPVVRCCGFNMQKIEDSAKEGANQVLGLSHDAEIMRSDWLKEVMLQFLPNQGVFFQHSVTMLCYNLFMT